LTHRLGQRSGTPSATNTRSIASIAATKAGLAFLRGRATFPRVEPGRNARAFFNAMTQFMGVMTDPFNASRGDPVSASGNAPQFAEEGVSANAYAAIYDRVLPPVASFEQRWSVWTSGFGGSQTTDGNVATGSNSTTSQLYGTAVGADYRVSPNTIAGFALAGGGTSFSVANGGSGHSDLFQSAALAYGWQDVTTNRAAMMDQLRARFDSNTFSGRVEAGDRWVMPWMDGIGLTPYAAAQFVTVALPAYAESALVGSSAFALSYSSKIVTDSRGELGLRSDQSFVVGDAILSLRGRAAWAYDFNTDRAASATFQALPGASFVVSGAAPAHNSALTTASAEIKWMNGWSAVATFGGEFSEVTRSYAGKGIVRYAW